MKNVSFLQLIRSDFRRYVATGAQRKITIILFSQGFWASCVYRCTHALHGMPNILLIRPAVRLGCQLARKMMEILTGISLPVECHIGEGLYIGHFGTIIISPLVKIGRNCNLSQGITLGWGGRGEKSGCPFIGDRVYIGANAVIAGPISIGHDAVIGAGAIVTKSVPPRAVVVGNPAHVASYRGSFEFIFYDGCEQDEERLASLKLREVDAPQVEECE